MYKRSAVCGTAAALAVAAGLMLAVHFWLIPSVSARIARAQLGRLTERYGVSVEFADAGYSRREGLVLHHVKAHEDDGRQILGARRLSIQTNLPGLLLGKREIQSLSLEEPLLRLHGDTHAVVLAARRIGVAGRLELNAVQLRVGLVLAGRGDQLTELFEAEEAALVTNGLPDSLADLDELDISLLRLIEPTAHTRIRSGRTVEWDAAAAIMQDLLSRLHSATGAEACASGDHCIAQPESELPEPQTSRQDSALLRGRLWSVFGRSVFPNELVINGAAISVSYDTTYGLDPAAPPADTLAFTELNLNWQLDRRRDLVQLNSSGRITADGKDAGRWVIDQALWYREPMVSGRAELKRLSLPALTQLAGVHIVDTPPNGTLDAELTMHRNSREGHTELNGAFRLRDASILLPHTALEAVEIPDFSYRFQGRLDPRAPLPAPRLIHPLKKADDEPRTTELSTVAAPQRRGSFVIEEGRLQLGSVKAEVRAAVHGLRGLCTLPKRLDLQVALPRTATQSILDSIPQAITGELAEVKLEGTFGWDFDLELPLDRAAAMRWVARPDLRDFSVRAIPESIDVFKLNRAFTHTIVDESVDYQRTVAIPPPRAVPDRWLRDNGGLTEAQIASKRLRRVLYNPTDLDTRLPNRPFLLAHREHDASHGTARDARYVYLAEMSDWVPRAIMTGEDNYFFRHKGINWPAIKYAVQFNLEAGEYQLGASTISMQLVKNLFLSHDRVLARKLQELFLVYLMEQVAHVPKERILEVYLNVIEFGPGVFGIHDAAQYYFNKSPSELEVLEAVWLAAIAPSPKHYHALFTDSDGSSVWTSRMDHHLDRLKTRNRITPERYEAAREQALRFDPRTRFETTDLRPVLDQRASPLSPRFTP